MPIRFRCVNCDSLLSVAERKAGSVVDCPKCKEGTIVPFLSGAPIGEKLPALEVPPLEVSPKIHEQYGLEISTKTPIPDDDFELDNEVTNHGERDERNAIRDSSNKRSFIEQNWKVFAGIGSVAFLIGIAIVTVILTSPNRSKVANGASRDTMKASSSVVMVQSPDLGKPSIKPIARPNLSPEIIFSLNSPGVVCIATYDKNGNPTGFGSGFMVHDDGLIATNYHVIKEAENAVVLFSDKSRAQVMGVVDHNSKADTAILKIDNKTQVKSLQLDGSALPSIGMKVYAIGNPEGFANTLSDGLISGHRELEGVSYIQTTSPISPGSSGGPLINPDGMVIGITTGGWKTGQNINFAVAVSQIRRFVEAYHIGGTIYKLPLVQSSKTLVAKSPEKGVLTEQEIAARDFDYEGVALGISLKDFIKMYPNAKEDKRYSINSINAIQYYRSSKSSTFAMYSFYEDKCYMIGLQCDLSKATEVGEREYLGRQVAKFGMPIIEKTEDPWLYRYSWIFPQVSRRVDCRERDKPNIASVTVIDHDLSMKLRIRMKELGIEASGK